MKRTGVLIVLAASVLLAGCYQPPGGGGGPANQSPLAIFSPDVSSGPGPLTVNFNASASSDPDGTIVGYSWDFGDFTSGSGQVISHTFTAGTYVVTLIVTDNLGATGSSTTTISVSGPPPAPTGLQLVGSGCCDTYGDFSWNSLPGVSQYQISMDAYFGGGCLTDHSATIAAPASSGRVQAVGLCLGSHYDTSIRAFANGQWGPWSPTINIVL